jgi:hypothetical protein
MSDVDIKISFLIPATGTLLWIACGCAFAKKPVPLVTKVILLRELLLSLVSAAGS